VLDRPAREKIGVAFSEGAVSCIPAIRFDALSTPTSGLVVISSGFKAIGFLA
jgi:hypothetical protein